MTSPTNLPETLEVLEKLIEAANKCAFAVNTSMMDEAIEKASKHLDKVKGILALASKPENHSTNATSEAEDFNLSESEEMEFYAYKEARNKALKSAGAKPSWEVHASHFATWEAAIKFAYSECARQYGALPVVLPLEKS